MTRQMNNAFLTCAVLGAGLLTTVAVGANRPPNDLTAGEIRDAMDPGPGFAIDKLLAAFGRLAPMVDHVRGVSR